MTITLPTVDGNYEIEFTRVKDSRKLSDAIRDHVNLFRVETATLCRVYAPGYNPALGCDMNLSGWALCARCEPDGYDPAKGRRKSLAHAIHDLSESSRALVWHAYNKRFPPGHEKSTRHSLAIGVSPLGGRFPIWGTNCKKQTMQEAHDERLETLDRLTKGHQR